MPMMIDGLDWLAALAAARPGSEQHLASAAAAADGGDGGDYHYYVDFDRSLSRPPADRRRSPHRGACWAI